MLLPTAQRSPPHKPLLHGEPRTSPVGRRAAERARQELQNFSIFLADAAPLIEARTLILVEPPKVIEPFVGDRELPSYPEWTETALAGDFDDDYCRGRDSLAMDA